ncbi:hypothetical protein V500_04648, partial [Pseudogymnoascus sp. VKM F-4518 (FW-2643)]
MLYTIYHIQAPNHYEPSTLSSSSSSLVISTSLIFSSRISRHVLQLSTPNATTISPPPATAAGPSGTPHRAGETDQHEEAARERGVREDADAHHPRRLASRERKRFQARVVQDGQRDPEDEEGECADEGAEGVCEDHAAAGAAACGGAGEALVEDLVEAVEDGAGADDEVSSEAVLGLGVGGGGGG